MNKDAMGTIKLTDEERDSLLKAIDEAEARVAQHEGGFTVEEARSLLRDCLEAPFWEVLKNHKAERLLN